MKKKKPFYQLKIDERLNYLENEGINLGELNRPLSNEAFDLMIENFITTYELPTGVVNDVLVNDRFFNLVLSTEEPSVIAGINKAVKIINSSGGFTAKVINNLPTGQIIIKTNGESNNILNRITILEDKFLKLAKESSPEIYSLGGGIKEFDYRIINDEYISLDISVDSVDAMGANLVNTILESIKDYLTSLDFNVLSAIITNLAINQLVSVECRINLVNNKYLNVSSAKKIEELTNYAKLDPFRATTHNKGILNGVTSLIIPSGNDFRANSASIITYSLINNKIEPLSNWRLSNNDEQLIGTIQIPVQVGTYGTHLNKIPKVKLFKEISKINNKDDLMILAAVSGLSSNFASLLALVTEGIQKGHMKLVSRNK